jgi:hypothetical protein
MTPACSIPGSYLRATATRLSPFVAHFFSFDWQFLFHLTSVLHLSDSLGELSQDLGLQEGQSSRLLCLKCRKVAVCSFFIVQLAFSFPLCVEHMCEVFFE